jgi:hypothetical protein
MRRITAVVLLALTVQGCTTYYYFGRISGQNSAGREVEALAYWQATERKLWYDTVDGAVRLKTACSHRTVLLNEREQGIVFLWEPGVVEPGGGGGPGTLCGRIVGADQMKDLGEGRLRIEILCEAEVEDFTADPHRAVFIAPRPGDPYVFEIRKEALDTAPDVACPN